MPFIRVDTVAGQYDSRQISTISDVLYEAVLGIGALKGDRFQAFAEHAPEYLVFGRDYLDIPRGDGFVAIQITLNKGRSLEQKKGFFAAIADGLHAKLNIRREDIFVNLIEVAKENWSFGNGVAQYADAS